MALNCVVYGRGRSRRFFLQLRFQGNSIRLLRIELGDKERQDVAVRCTRSEGRLNLTVCILQPPGASEVRRLICGQRRAADVIGSKGRQDRRI